MKKTLIALMALAGVATATDLMDFTARIDDPSIGFTTDSTTFSVAITLDPATLKDYLGAGQPLVKYELIQYSVTDTIKTGVVTNYSSGGTGKIQSSGLYYRWGNDYAWSGLCTTGGDNIITAPEGVTNLTQIDWDSVAAAGLVYTFAPNATKGTQVSFVLLDADNETIFASYNRAAGLTTSSAQPGDLAFAGAAKQAFYFNQELTAADVKRVAVQAALAPEPATATLSLLALAGLAARRRRH